MKCLSAKFSSLAVLSAASLFISTNAAAQEVEASAAIDPDGTAEEEAEAEAAAEAEAEAEAEERERAGDTDTMEPTEPRSDVEENDDGESDHDSVIGHFGVGYLGMQSMTVGVDRTTVRAPVVGVRYWLMDFMGIDAGFGLNVSGGKGTTTGADDVRKPGLGVYIFHVGLPLNLYDRGSFSFQAVPEMNLGLAFAGDRDLDPNAELKDRGIHYSVGARAGAELQFGFIGLPELSLQGSVGLYFQTERGATVTKPDGGDDAKATDSSVSFGTTLGNDPWDIFTGSISALYYF